MTFFTRVQLPPASASGNSICGRDVKRPSRTSKEGTGMAAKKRAFLPKSTPLLLHLAGFGALRPRRLKKINHSSKKFNGGF